jgi:hypothetical protein
MSQKHTAKKSTYMLCFWDMQHSCGILSGRVQLSISVPKPKKTPRTLMVRGV